MTFRCRIFYVAMLSAILASCEDPAAVQESSVRAEVIESLESQKRDEITRLRLELREDPARADELAILNACSAAFASEGAFRVKFCFDSRKEPWDYSESTSKMTDTKDIYLSTTAIPYTGKYGDLVYPTLNLRCQENTTAAYFTFNEYLGMGEIKVQYRRGDKPAQTRAMDISTDYNSAGYWSGAGAIPFIKSLLGHDKLVVRVTPYGENPREMTFPLTCLDEKITPLREQCGW